MPASCSTSASRCGGLRRAPLLLAMALPVLSLGGCMSWGPRTPQISVEQLRSLEVCNTPGSAPLLTWLPDLDAVQALQQSRGVDLIGPDALPTGPFVLLESGAQPGAGYGVAVSRRADWDEGVVTLGATFFAPPTAAANTQTSSSPCVLVALPPVQMHTIRLVDANARVLASVHTQARAATPSTPNEPTP
jgi:hypothetical protein